MYLYQQTIEEMVASGKLSAEEAEKKMSDYQSRLVSSCSMVETNSGQIQIDRQKRYTLLEEFKRIGWRLQLIEEQTENNIGSDSLKTYLNFKRQKAINHLKNAIKIARSLFHDFGDLRQDKSIHIQMEAINQVTHEKHRVRLPSWYWPSVSWTIRI